MNLTSTGRPLPMFSAFFPLKTPNLEPAISSPNLPQIFSFSFLFLFLLSKKKKTEAVFTAQRPPEIKATNLNRLVMSSPITVLGIA